MAEAPVPVKFALEALKVLEAEDAVLAEESRRKLPGFALRMAASGEEVTVEKLLAAARAREIDKAPAPQQKAKTYAEIVAAFPGEKADNEVDIWSAPVDRAFSAAMAGDFEWLKRLIGNRDDYVRVMRLKERIFNEGSLDIIKFVREECGIEDTEMLNRAMRADRLDAVKYLIEECGVKILNQRKEFESTTLMRAVSCGHLDIVKYLVEECGADVRAGHEAVLTNAATQDLEIIKYLVACGADFYGGDPRDNPFARAAHCAQLDTLKYFVEKRGKPPEEMADRALHKVVTDYSSVTHLRLRTTGRSMETAKFLVEECGADPSVLVVDICLALEKYIAVCAEWQKTVHADAPYALIDEDSAFFKPLAYKAVNDLLRQEKGHVPYDHYNLRMAFYASGLFGTEDRVLQYLEKWGRAGQQPLNDLIQKIKLPGKKTPEMDLTAWADAVLKCGPSMAKLVKFADKLPVPEKSEDGKTWSLRKTREAVAQFVYPRGRENPALAALCFEKDVNERTFNKALEIYKNAPAVKNIPDITINGEKFDMPGAAFHRLAANDVRGLFLGELTDCCQSIGGAGAECAEHGFTSENSGFYVVENAKGQVVGQTWAWRGEEGELVFDSIETLGKNVEARQWKKLTEQFAAALAKMPSNDITAFHLGKGGMTPDSLTQAFGKAASPAKPVGYDGYRDSHKQVVVWQKKAGLKNG